VFGHLSTGAADDLRRVTDIAHSMVTRYGMSEKVGNVAYDRDPRSFLTGPDLPSPPHERDYAEKTAATVDEEVRSNVENAFQRALKLLRERRAVLDRTARRLLETETLEEAELMRLINDPESRSPQVAAE
jgi:cell division protease FtsH